MGSELINKNMNEGKKILTVVSSTHMFKTKKKGLAKKGKRYLIKKDCR